MQSRATRFIHVIRQTVLQTMRFVRLLRFPNDTMTEPNMLAFIRIVLILTPCVVLTSTNAQQETTNFVISDAWIREAPPNAMALAGFMMIDNSDDHKHQLLGASSPAFEWIEMHRTVHDGNIVRMVPLNSLPLPSGGRLTMEPGGNHLMLMNPNTLLRAGDEVTITLTFENGLELAVPFRVEKTRLGHKD